MLQNPPFLHNPLKLVKYSDSLASPASTQEESITQKRKIQPIPILHTELKNNENLRKKFVVQGHKYHSNLSASGRETSQILQGIRKSRGLKFVRNFEFDPYLCDNSYLDLLSKALAKLNYTKGINLVIRRLEKSDDVKKMNSKVVRIQRLEKLRLELPRTQNINDQSLIDLGNVVGKCYSIKRIDHSTLNLENITESAHLKSSKRSKKLLKVRHVKRVIQKSEILHDICNFKTVQKSTYSRLKVQSIDLRIGFPTGWFSMSTEYDESTLLILKALAYHQELKSLNLQFTGNPTILETMQMLGETVPKIQSLKKFSLELLNSKVTESEMFAMIQMIPNITHIEEFTFKVLQYPNVEIACIFCLVSRLSMYKNFKKINLYFRRLNIEDDELREVVNRIQSLDEMSCVLGKNSLYIYKKVCDESIFGKKQLNFEDVLQ